MRRTFTTALLTLSVSALFASVALADVIIQGPFGQIVVKSSADVRVGPGVFVGVPSKAPVAVPPLAGQNKGKGPAIVSKPGAVVRPDDGLEPLPPPKVLGGGSGGELISGHAAPAVALPAMPTKLQPIAPRDFARTFKPAANAASYEVLFIHPLSNKHVTVAFALPSGTPRISSIGNAVVFDYGRDHEVEIRFQHGGRVQVTSR